MGWSLRQEMERASVMQATEGSREAKERSSRCASRGLEELLLRASNKDSLPEPHLTTYDQPRLAPARGARQTRHGDWERDSAEVPIIGAGDAAP